MSVPATNRPEMTQSKCGITKMRVRGFKSINQEQEIEIRPLTILAGANSSGKSSMIQPLLLLKQTLEVAYDPGALWLNGPNVKFTSSDQFLSRCGERDTSFSIGLTVVGSPLAYNPQPSHPPTDLEIVFSQQVKSKKLDVQRMSYKQGENNKTLEAGMFLEGLPAIRHRCFLDIGFEGTNYKIYLNIFGTSTSPSSLFGSFIQEVIHLPGLRGNPERVYPVAAVGSMFPGTFDKYAASVIAHWQENGLSEKLQALEENLSHLGLTWKVQVSSVDETQIELRVGRLPQGTQNGSDALVNIADVGLGVSQTLPVLVALQEAQMGQLVYLEQPEIHLHPRAQTAMAKILADAAAKGVRVVIETHSSLLLLAVQTLVAEGYIPPDLVKLHWFTRDEDGSTHITSADLDETGAFGDWPEDFADVELEVQSRYLDAAESHDTSFG